MTAEQKIIEYISAYVPIEESERESILSALKYDIFPKGTHLLREGQVSRFCYFNIEGLVRQYEIVDGEERSTDFYLEGEAIVAFESGAKKTPCTFNWVCEEDTTLVIGDLEGINDTYARHPKLEKMSGMFIAREFGKYQNISSTFITSTPEQRYLKLMYERPQLLRRVPQYHIASYLGVKPETLSRIRKRLAEG